MKYFKELLESYSRLKKRQLVLLEMARPGKAVAEGQREAEAAYTQAQNELKHKPEFTYRSPQPGKILVFKGNPAKTISVSIGGPRYFVSWNKVKSKVYNYLQPTDQAGVRKDGKIGSSAEPEKIKPELSDDLAKMAQELEGASLKDPKLSEKMLTMGQKIKGSLKNLLTKYYRKVKDPEGTPEGLHAAFFSRRQGSFEWALGNAILFKKSASKEGKLTIESGKISDLGEEEAQAIRQEAISRMEACVNVIEKMEKNPESVTKEDIDLINSTFKLRGNCRAFKNGGKSENCRVLISTGTGRFEGLVFNDTNGALKTLIRAAEESSKKVPGDARVDIQQAKIYEDANGRANIVRLSKITEISTVITSHQKMCGDVGKHKENPKLANYCDKRKQMILEKYSDDMQRVSDLINEYNLQIEKNGELGMLADSEFEELLDFFGPSDEAKQALKASMSLAKRLSNRSLEKRNPDLIFNVGKEVGFGKRTDNIELYNSEESLNQSLLNDGYSEKDIEKFKEDGTIRCGQSAKQAFRGAQDEYELARSNNVVNDSSTYCTFNISEKNYVSFSDGGMKSGSQRMSTVGSVLSNTAPPGKEKEVQEARESMKKNLGFKDSDLADCSKVHEELSSKVDNTLTKLAIKQKVVINGKEVEAWDKVETAKSMLKHLRENNSIDSLGRPPLSTLLQKAEALKKDPKADPDELFREFASFSKMKLISEGLSGKDSMKYKKYAAALIFSSGGASDGTMVNAQAMVDQRRYSFRQNAIFDFVRDAMRDPSTEDPNQPPQEWDFVTEKDGSISVVNKKNQDLSLTLQMSAVRKKSDSETKEDGIEETGKLNQNCDASISEEMMRALSGGRTFDIKDKKDSAIFKGINSSTEYSGELLIEFLSSNKDVFKKLIEFIKIDASR